MKIISSTTWRQLGLAAATIASLGLLTACNNDSKKAVAVTPDVAAKTTTCLWRGPLTAFNPETNFAYPDAGAYYWSAIGTIPTGARMFIKGQYPHARYISYVSYEKDVPEESLADIAIAPEPGSTNPFVPGNLRTLDKRDYRIEVVQATAPAEGRPANTLYAPGEAGTPVTLIYRIYVPDNGKDIMGGVALPDVELKLADGRTLQGEAACQALNASPDVMPRIAPSKEAYLAARDQPGRPAGWPARETPIWYAAYNVVDNFKCIYYDLCTGSPTRHVNFYANPDNAYTFANLNRMFGEVVVLRGKMPATTQTFLGDMYAQEGQLRYWSMCSNENYSQKVTACLYDQQVPINADGNYTIVVARTEDRPSNATLKCGAGYLEWSKEGDGLGHTDDNILLMRNMLPASGFANAIQQTTTWGDEEAVIGEYLPSITYMSKEAFEAQGCPSFP